MISAVLLGMCINGVIQHEGYSHTMYKDRNGWSIGYGYSLTQNPLGLDKKTIANMKRYGVSEASSRQLVTQLCLKSENALEAKFEWFKGMSNPHKYVMLDMTYNLGIGGIEKFDRAIYHLKNHHNTAASRELLQSKWAKQVHGRAIELASIVKSNKV